MKIFSIVGFALAANSMLASGLVMRGSNAPRLSVQTQSQEPLAPVNLGDLQQQEELPAPYQFAFDTNSEGSSTSRQESGDASGKVIGQYAIKGSDGRERLVSYTADREGFRANITTNEHGTESQRPSFVILQSSQLPAADISRQLQAEIDLAQQEEQPLEEQPAELPAAPQNLKSVGAPPRKSSSLKSTSARRSAAQSASLSQQRQLQSESDLAQQDEQSSEEQPAELSAPQKSVGAPPRKSNLLKSNALRRPAAQQAPLPQRQSSALASKPRRPTQQAVAPSKRPISASPSKGAVRSRGQSKTVSASTTQRARSPVPAKKPIQTQAQEEEPEAIAEGVDIPVPVLASGASQLNLNSEQSEQATNEEESQDF